MPFSFVYKKNFSKFIIIENNDSSVFFKILKLNRDFFFLYRPESKIIYYNSSVFINIVKVIFSIFKYKNNYKLSFFNFVYTLALFITAKPELVMTYNDDSKIFFTLINNFKKIKFVSIQNGHRLPGQYKNRSFTADYYFSWGNLEKKQFKKFNIKYNKLIPIGSIAAAYYLEKFKNSKIKYDICLIETSGNLPKFFKNHLKKNELKNNLSLYYEYERIFYENLRIFLNKYKYKLVIALRGSKKDITSNNFNLLKSYFGDCVIYKETKQPQDVYRVVSESRLIIGFSSSVIRESLAYDKKILFIDYVNNKYLNNINKSIFLFTLKKNNFINFEKKLVKLIKTPSKNYKKIINKYKKLIMNINTKVPIDKIFKKKLKEILYKY